MDTKNVDSAGSAALARSLGMASLVVACLALAPPPAPAAEAAATRAIPIRLRELPRADGKQVYSIAIHHGARDLEAVLDTGSVPSLVLPDRVPPRDARPTGATFSVTYGGDRTYSGDVVTGPVRIGGASGTMAFGAVTSAHCLTNDPNCPIAGEPPRRARFGDLYPAIVGARLATLPGQVQTAFSELGTHGFIITAPRRGEGDGKLLLDPNANETSGYVPIYTATATDAPSGSARGCLRDTTKVITICGPVFFDSGRTGIEIHQAQDNPQYRTWAAKDAGQLEFTDPNGAEVAGVDFVVDADSATSVTFSPTYGQYAEPVIYVGQLPYLGLSVMTDLDHGGYAVSPRSKARDGTVGHVP